MMGAVAFGQGLSFLWLLLLTSESGAVRGGVDRELAVRGASGAYALTRAIRANVPTDANRVLQVPRRRDAFSARIVGGSTARNGRYPYAQISLATEAGLHQCGGSLIAPDIILTAGHCHGFFTQVRVNMYNLDQELESFEVFKAERMHFNPSFDELWFRYDFLILKLNGTVRGVEPVRLNSDDSLPIPDDPLTVIGWGLTIPDDTTSYPDEMREVTVNYVSNDICEQTTSKGQQLYKGYIFDDMMCAYGSGKDACSGDSGAPLIRPGSSPAWDVVVAVVSWGNGCATEYPGVYARISYQYPWIKDLVCAMSVSPPEYFECPSNSNSHNQLGANFLFPSPAPLAGLRPTTAPPTTLTVPDGHLPVKVEIQLDLRSKDTGWSIVSGDGIVLAEVDAGSYSQPYGLIEQVVMLPTSSQFLLILTDTQGDGICCEFGGGWFQVSVVMTDGSTNRLMKGYGTFTLSTSNMFETPPDNIPKPSLAPGEEPPQLGTPLLTRPTPLEQIPLADPNALSQSAGPAPWYTTFSAATAIVITVIMLYATEF